MYIHVWKEKNKTPDPSESAGRYFIQARQEAEVEAIRRRVEETTRQIGVSDLSTWTTMISPCSLVICICMQERVRHVEELQAEGWAKEHQIQQLQNEVATKEDSRRQLVVSSLPMCGVTDDVTDNVCRDVLRSWRQKSRPRMT